MTATMAGARAITILALLATGAAASAERLSPQALADLSLVDVPLVLDGVDTTGRTEQLWVSGAEPANTLLARLTLRPLEVAGTRLESGGDVVLWRAFTGGGITRLAASELPLDGAPRRYCGIVGTEPRAVCLSDDDGDGRFDTRAPARAERGGKPYHVTLARRFTALPQPIAYTVLPPAQRPAIEVRLRNCAKDYDRPRFSAISTEDRTDPVMPPFLGWHDKDSSFAGCRRGRQITSFPGHPAPAGGFLAQLGPLAVSVGPRQGPALGVLGPVDGDALYRIEANTLVDLRVGATRDQAEIVALKKFPEPVLLAETGATITQGQITPGQVLARVPFHHAYRGRLTEDVAIRTLLGSRSLAAGSVLYGYPARSSLSATINGSPVMSTMSEDSFRKINVSLTWCTPVPGVPPKKPSGQEIGRGGWSAACIPESPSGTYTILTDRQPALATVSLSYDATTSSNPGRAPVERDDDARFDRPLRLEYVFERHEGESIRLRENIYFGDELTSSAPEVIYAPEGVGAVTVADAALTLARNPDGTITVAAAGAPVAGANAQLEWDRSAMMLAQLKRMGLRVAGESTPPAAPAPAPGD